MEGYFRINHALASGDSRYYSAVKNGNLASCKRFSNPYVLVCLKLRSLIFPPFFGYSFNFSPVALDSHPWKMLWPYARRVKIEQLTHPSPLSILRGTYGKKIWLEKSNLIHGVTFMQWNSIVCSAASVSRDARPITWSYYTHTLGSGVRITAKVLYGWDVLTRAAWPYPFENHFVLLLYSCYKHRMKTPHASFPYSKGRQNDG